MTAGGRIPAAVQIQKAPNGSSFTARTREASVGRGHGRPVWLPRINRQDVASREGWCPGSLLRKRVTAGVLLWLRWNLEPQAQVRAVVSQDFYPGGS